MISKILFVRFLLASHQKLFFLYRTENYYVQKLSFLAFIVQINSKPAKRKSRIIYSNSFLDEWGIRPRFVHKQNFLSRAKCEDLHIDRMSQNMRRQTESGGKSSMKNFSFGIIIINIPENKTARRKKWEFLPNKWGKCF